jgi:hypothetical protein
MKVPDELVAYHTAGGALCCRLPVNPYLCEFWPVAELDALNRDCGILQAAPGHVGFATNGAGELFVVTPDGSVVCLDACGMSVSDALQVAPSWMAFVSLLQPVA